MSMPVFIPAMAATCAIGMDVPEIAGVLFRGTRNGLALRPELSRIASPLGALPQPLPVLPQELSRFDCRNNRLLAHLAEQIRPSIDRLLATIASERIAIVIGTSTSGIAEAMAAIQVRLAEGNWPGGFAYEQQEIGGGALFLAEYLGIDGPAFVVATACSSSAKAFASARRLIANGIVDGAIVGGADTLCELTVTGFDALGALDPAPCNPFSLNRNGINIGEGGALFVLTRTPSEIMLAGIGESSDAHHISAPEPDGRGAEAAIAAALADAGVARDKIGYVNLHGTGTSLNDAMESRAMARIFAHDPPCSSTKAMTGHTLGAAGALEAAFSWLVLSRSENPGGLLPPHLWDGVHDPALPQLNLAKISHRIAPTAEACLSSSFAFGGSNCALVLKRKPDDTL